MNLVEAIVLGIIQGVAEWLPISSKGISTIVMLNFFGRSFSDALLISVWLHVGTLLAAVIYFRKDLKRILLNLPAYARRPAGMEGYSGITNFLIISTAFTGIAAVPLVVFELTEISFSWAFAMGFIGILMILTGIMLKLPRGHKKIEDRTRVSDAALTGFVQGFSALPGISRSGITTSALLLRKHEPEFALKLSFLMSIPAILIAEIGLGMGALGEFSIDLYSIVAILFSFVFGMLTLKSLLTVAHKINFGWFCMGLGALCIIAVFL